MLESIDTLAQRERRANCRFCLGSNLDRPVFTPLAAFLEPQEGVSQPTMSLRGLKAWFGRGAAEDEDETMVRDPNV